MKIIHFLLIICLSVCILPVNIIAQPGAIDHSFNPTDIGYGNGDGARSGVLSTVIQPDGKILISGSFYSYNATPRPCVARLNTGGTLDGSFNPGSGANNDVYTLALQPDGKILISGKFTIYNGTPRNYIARLNADGTLDGSFNPGTGANYNVYTLVLQPDGKILIGGSFTNYNGTPRNYVARLNADGTLDASFNPGTGANNYVYTLALQPDGKILIGGIFTNYNGTPRNYIACLNADGTLDGSFNPGMGANGGLNTLALQPDGKILIGGWFTSYNGTLRNRIARLNTGGTLDGSFNPGTGANGEVYTLALQPDGKILIGGIFTNYNGTPRNYIARLNADGTLDGSFNPGTGVNSIIHTWAFQPGGKILIGGSFAIYNGTPRNCIARLNADGTLDGSFNPGMGANNFVLTMVLQHDGKILIGGWFYSYNDTYRNRIARLNADGTLDGSFNPGTGANWNVVTLALQPDGKILIGGEFTSYNGTPRNYIARLNADGTLDGSFNPGTGANSNVYTLALQPDGKILIGGYFTNYNGTPRNYVARLNADGTLDASFNPGSGANNWVFSLAPQPDGKILIGGVFTSYNGTPRNYIARLNADGTLDASFNPGSGANNWVFSLAPQPDGKILIGGSFTSYNGTTRNRIARLNADGTLDGSFNPGTGANGTVNTLALQPDGKILIGGVFTSYNGTQRNRIARLNADGTLDATFNPGTGANATVYTTSIQPDGKILIGGDFTSYNGTGRNRIARILNSTLVITVFPKIYISKAILNVGETQTITGKDFTNGGQVNLVIKNSSGDVLPVGAITYLPNGGFTYQLPITSTMPDGEYTVYAKDINTGQTTGTIKFKVNNPVTRKLWINKPLGTDSYCTGQEFQINWGDYIDKTSVTISDFTGLVTKMYKVEITNNNGSSWVVLKDGLPVDVVMSGQNNTFRFEYKTNTPGTYKIRITDKENPANFNTSEDFNVANNVTGGFKAELVWDKSSPVPTNKPPIGLAADGTCMIQIDLKKQGGNSKTVSQIVATIIPVDNSYTGTALLGKIIHADNPNIYTLEGNNAISTSTAWPPTPGSVPNITNTSFWLVAPDDFTHNLDNDSKQRKINVEFQIKYTDNTHEFILASCNSILIRRPALMLVHGLNGTLITFQDFKYQIGTNAPQRFDLDGSPWVIRKRIELDPKDYLMENAKIVLRKHKYLGNYGNSFQDLLNEMHKDGFANNRVDYVCHSMGGAVARTIINQFSGLNETQDDDFSPKDYRENKYMNYRKGFINKLITINTPHNGSYVADLVIDRYLKNWAKMTWAYFTNQGVRDFFEPTVGIIPFKPAPAIRDMQAFDNGITFKETTIKNHLIASDIDKLNNMSEDDIFATPDDFFPNFLPKYKKFSGLLLDENETIHDAINNDYSNSSYLNNTDLVVPVSSQLPGKLLSNGDISNDVAIIGENLNLKAEKNASIIYGIDKQHEGRGRDPVVGTRVFHLLNAPINSGFFENSIEASPAQQGGTVYRNSLVPDTVFTYFDTSFIKISSPVSGNTVYVDSSLRVNLKLKDTTGFREITLGFQGEIYSSVSPISDQIFDLKISSSFIGKNILVAQSMYDSLGYTVNHVDIITLNVKALDTLKGFYINPKSQNLNPVQTFQLEYNAIFTNYIGGLNSDIDSLNFAIADTNVVRFDSLLYHFITKDTGTTHIVFNYKGFSDTAFIYISRPLDENIKNACTQSIISFYAGTNDSTKNYQWQVDTLNGFENIIPGAIYSQVDSSTLILNNPPTNWYNYRYRCIISDSIGETTSPAFTLRFAVTWIGVYDTAWGNTANWSCGSLPDSNTDVIIKSVATRFPQVNTNVTCRSLTVQSGAAVLVKTGYIIDITGKDE